VSAHPPPTQSVFLCVCVCVRVRACACACANRSAHSAIALHVGSNRHPAASHQASPSRPQCTPQPREPYLLISPH
jgi:hypothetical protein